MSSTLSSGWFTCSGCFKCFKWDSDKVDTHTKSCKEYKTEMKRRQELYKQAITIPLGKQYGNI